MIAGGMDSVFLAREMIIGCLPVILMSDIPPGAEPEIELVQAVMEKYRVLVSTKPKPRAQGGTRMLVIKGVERNIFDVFEARR